MSVNSSISPLGTQPSAAGAAGDVTPPAAATNTAPALQAREPAAVTGWRDLPSDVLGLLLKDLITQVRSPSAAPAERFEALLTLQQLGGIAKQEKAVFQTFLANNQLDLGVLRKEILDTSRPEWKSNAAAIAAQHDTLMKDFSVTREALASSKSSGLPLALPESCEGVHLCFREISLSEPISQLISGLEGKTVKVDATNIGRDRFVAEVLPVLEKLPASCKLILDAAENGLTAPDLDRLTSVMSRRPFFYRLDLSSNPLPDGGNYPQSFASLFRHAGPLTHLYLAGTGFDKEAVFALKRSFAEARLLERLDLRNNLLDEEAAIALINTILPDESDVSELPRLDALRAVRLGGNPYTGDEAVRDAKSQMEERWMTLIGKGHSQSPDDYIAFNGDVRELFEIYGPANDPMTLANIRLYDNRAASNRL